HSRAAGFILGLNASQLNRNHDYEGIVDNQLRALDHAGLFKTSLAKPAGTLPHFVNPYDEKANLDDRVRTYLHVNCSICHVSDGGGNSLIELDSGRKLADTKAIDTRPVQGTFGITEPRIIAPGNPERSVLYYRISSLGGARMPRVGSRVVDEKWVDLVHKWIEKLPPSGQRPADDLTRQSHEQQIARLGRGSHANKRSRVEAIRNLTATTSGALAL